MLEYSYDHGNVYIFDKEFKNVLLSHPYRSKVTPVNQKLTKDIILGQNIALSGSVLD